ncbi:MAG: lysoplasmalogenase [Ferruginibacter sp.]
MFKKAIAFYWLLVFLELIVTLFDLTTINFFVKPLLMPALIVLLLQGANPIKEKKIVLIGLICAWLGDTFLLFETKDPLFFIAGLASFLLTHVCYIIYFLRLRVSSISMLKKQPIIILLVIAYGAGLFIFLNPYLGDLKIPVLVYAIVICSMLLCAVHIYSRVNEPSNKLYVAGALFFVVSDSLLAINKFYMPLFLSHSSIMLTYCMAQYFIVSGCVREKLSAR